MQRPVKQLERLELYHQVLAKNSCGNDCYWHEIDMPMQSPHVRC